MKKHKRVKRIIALLIALALTMGGLAGCNKEQKAYKKASSFFDDGDYAAAAEVFDGLGGYSDAAERADEARYELAAELFKNGKYDEAERGFRALGNFKDSRKRAELSKNEGDYEKAAALLQEGKWSDAAEAFKALGEFKDAPELVKLAENEQMYEEAVKAYEAGDYEDAEWMFSKLGDFKDSAERWKKVCYEIAIELYDDGKYQDAAGRFEELGDYEDSAVRAKSARELIVHRIRISQIWLKGRLLNKLVFVGGHETLVPLADTDNWFINGVFESGDFTYIGSQAELNSAINSNEPFMVSEMRIKMRVDGKVYNLTINSSTQLVVRKVEGNYFLLIQETLDLQNG